jgi:hypothetical protein
MGKLINFFKRLGTVSAKIAMSPAGLAVINVLAPGAGSLAGTIITSILAAEQKFGRGKGAEKGEYALELIGAASPAVIENMERMLGKELVDQERFAAVMARLRDDYVEVLSCFDVLPAKQQTALPQSSDR